MAHRVQLQLSKRSTRDLVVCLALSGRTLAEWIRTELTAGIADPPRMFIRPNVEEPETFTLELSDEIVMGCWGIAQALEADCGERVIAGDVFAFLLARAVRRDVIAMRANRSDDFDFLASQFADLRNPGDEPRDEAVVRKLNSLLTGVGNDLVIVLPVQQRDAQAQAAQDAQRAAEQQRMAEQRLAEHVRLTEERNRLARLLAV